MLSAFLARLARTFPRNLTVDSVETVIRFEDSPEQVWECLMFFEDVPYRPGPLLRWLLPSPIQTCGEIRDGALIPAVYAGGYLERRITGVEPGRSLRFSVVTQELGVEDCVTVLGGSQRVRAHGTGAELVLTSDYLGHVKPRFLARVVERFAARQVHAHTIKGVTRKMVARPDRESPFDSLVPGGWERVLREGQAADRRRARPHGRTVVNASA